MTELNNLVRSLTPDERENLGSFLKSKNRRNDVKNIDLLKLLSNSTLSNQEVFKSLYPSNKRGAYHALRKRLYDSIIDFIANENLNNENSLESTIIKLIVAARSLFFKKQYKTAYQVLEKAEKLAHENLLFPLLAEIYHTQIQYSYINSTINLEQLIHKSETNLKQYVVEEKLNHIYAHLRKQIKEQHSNQQPIHFTQLLENQLRDSNINVEKDFSFKSLYQIMTIASLSAYLTKDYNSIEDFLVMTYQKITKQSNRQSQNYYHIQVLYQLANMYFRNKKFEKSLQFLDLMLKQMKNNSNKHYKAFILKHQNLLALNYNYTNKNKLAINIALDSLSIKHPDTETSLDLQLCLSMYHFHNNNFKEALKILNSLYHSDNWYRKKTNEEWIMKKNLIEILIHIELDNVNIVESRILSFKRKHFELLKNQNQDRAITFISLIEEYYITYNKEISTNFIQKTKDSFVFKEAIYEDIFIMSFYAWLKAKTLKQNTYTTTLEMIKHC